MNFKLLILGILIFTIAQSVTWFQINAQFIWDWAKRNQMIVALLGVPISYMFQNGTRIIVAAFDGTYWPARFISFGTGIIIYAVLVNSYFNEGLSTKTIISLSLAVMILIVQVFWK